METYHKDHTELQRIITEFESAKRHKDISVGIWVEDHVKKGVLLTFTYFGGSGRKYDMFKFELTDRFIKVPDYAMQTVRNFVTAQQVNDRRAELTLNY